MPEEPSRIYVSTLLASGNVLAHAERTSLTDSE